MLPLNHPLIAHLEAGGTILTANRRQARILRRQHDEAQVAAGRRCWASVDVLPLEAWLVARWQELAGQDNSLPVLLAEAEARWPWRRTAEGVLDPTLISLPDLSAAARRAWLQLHRYGASLEALEREFLTRDQQQFLVWARDTERLLGTQGWLDPGQLEVALAKQGGRLPRQQPLLLVGFERASPSLRKLMQSLGAGGTRVAWASAASLASAPLSCATRDAADEIRAWIGWARRRLDERPGARLAVIVPDLQQRRAAIERALEETLQPDLEFPGAAERDRAFDLAGGPPLAGLATAAVALDVVDTVDSTVDFAVLSRLLRSQYVLGGDDPEGRVRLDVHLRERGLPSWPLAALSRLAGSRGCRRTAEALERSLALHGASAHTMSADGWARCFGEALAAWGWPGDGALASDEYQAAEAVRDRLGQLARVLRTAPRLDRGQARAELTRLMSEPFQPERGMASLWVLDSLEPLGIEFDGLWVSGMTAATWPQPARHDPFLPLPLQRRLELPGATAELALDAAVQAVGAWRREATELVFSWPLRQDDAAVEPSRVLPEAMAPFARPAASVTRPGAMLDAACLEAPDADPVPRLAEAPRGGSRILELQAKCPFRAFAELRLASHPLQEPAGGVDARARGTVLHGTLERAWRRLGGQQELVALGPSGRATLVEECVDEALAAEVPAELGSRARALERDWQRAAATAALELDLKRQAFEVLEIEGELETRFSGLPLHLRADRVDRVGDGLVVLDYKTGRASITQWRGTRPDAPQLPLYAVVKGESVGGVAFVAVGAGQAACRGVGREAQRLPGMTADDRFALTDEKQRGYGWDDIRRHWAVWLGNLARSFQAGSADVDPKLPDTCKYCHLQMLCRVAPGFDDAGQAVDDD